MPKASKILRVKIRLGFSLVELLAVIAIIGVLSSILLPALAKAKARAQGVYCLNNTRQVTVACLVYADESNGSLPYNLGVAAKSPTAKPPMEKNWANNVLDWELSTDNTNAAALVASGIGPYLNGSAKLYRCPADYVVSGVQKSAGWNSRVRSYSMNAMVGDAGAFTEGGYNVNNRSYQQFFKYASIPRPSDIFVFVEEHPDTITDGYFLNKAEYPRWHDLPASYHDGAAAFSFADGHSEMHQWRRAATKQPARPGAAQDLLRKTLKSNEVEDFVWVLSTMSVERKSDSYSY